MPTNERGASRVDGTRLVTRADDAANTKSTNRAVLDGFNDGILRNVSVMAPGPALDHAADLLADIDGLCVGIHITLTSEWDSPRWKPVLPPDAVPSLVDRDGVLLRDPATLEAKNANPDEMLQEALAQLNRLRDVGFDIDYFDDHMWARKANGFGAKLSDLVESGLIDGQTAVDRLSEEDWPATEAELIDALESVSPGRYLVVGHPGYETSETRQIAGGRQNRARGEWAAVMERQRRMFMGRSIVEYCADNPVQPIQYTDLRC
jgi:hypothetical protein